MRTVSDQHWQCLKIQYRMERGLVEEFLENLRSGGPDEVGEQTVASGFDSRVVFDDGETEDVELEANGGTGALESGQGVGHEQKFRSNARVHAISAAFGSANQLVTHARGANRANLFFAQITNSGPLHLFDGQRYAHQNVHEGGNFHSGVPTVEILRRISFRDAHGLRSLDGFVKRAAFLHFGQ